MRIADLAADTRVMKTAQEEAMLLLKTDPRLQKPEHAALAGAIRAMFQRSLVLN